MSDAEDPNLVSNFPKMSLRRLRLGEAKSKNICGSGYGLLKNRVGR
jgi:hypothetical protein